MTNLKEGDKIKCRTNLHSSNFNLELYRIYTFDRYNCYNKDYVFTKEVPKWHAHISNFCKIETKTPKGNKRRII